MYETESSLIMSILKLLTKGILSILSRIIYKKAARYNTTSTTNGQADTTSGQTDTKNTQTSTTS